MHNQSTTASPDRSKKTRPIHEIRLGPVRAAIWENHTEKGTRHNVTVSRVYKIDNQWKDTTSFNRDDLLLVSKVVDMCHTWIYRQPMEKTVESG